MKKGISRIIVTSLILCMLAGSNTFAVTKTLSLPKEQTWKTASTEKRTNKYSNVYVRLNAVYPISGKDTFTKARVKLYSDSTAISSEKTLTECGTGGSKSTLAIKEGYLNKTSVTFKWRGNNAKYAATASVYYDPR